MTLFAKLLKMVNILIFDFDLEALFYSPPKTKDPNFNKKSQMNLSNLSFNIHPKYITPANFNILQNYLLFIVVYKIKISFK